VDSFAKENELLQLHQDVRKSLMELNSIRSEIQQVGPRARERTCVLRSLSLARSCGRMAARVSVAPPSHGAHPPPPPSASHGPPPIDGPRLSRLAQSCRPQCTAKRR